MAMDLNAKAAYIRGLMTGMDLTQTPRTARSLPP